MHLLKFAQSNKMLLVWDSQSSSFWWWDQEWPNWIG